MIDGRVSQGTPDVSTLCRIFNWPEQRTGWVVGMSGGSQVFLDTLKRDRMDRNIANLRALPVHTYMENALPFVNVAYDQLA
jgi:hypothetical protein